jgi:hypothetical protein
MAYCDWDDVLMIFPEAGDIEADAADKTALLAEGAAETDAFLSPHMLTPVQQSGGAYPLMVVRINSYFVADLVLQRQTYTERGEQYALDYDGETHTRTSFGHRALQLCFALARSEAALADQITVPEVKSPLVETSFSTTNGTVVARYESGIYTRTSGASYVFEVESAGGTVAGDDLTFSVVRDNYEDVYASASPLAVNGTGWHSIEYGLQVRFIDADTSPAWTDGETFEVTCESFESDVKTSGIRTIEVPLA